MKAEDFTWEDVVNAEPGKVFIDRMDEGLRFIIMRGPFHLCAYIGIPLDHPLAGYDYDSLPIDCHGGLTFANKGEGTYLPEGRYWYGWDYGHCGDYSIYKGTTSFRESGKKWGVKDVDSDSWTALYEFKKLATLAERIARGRS